jgi:tetratricopeptide (TPR) repeat protein
VYCETRPDPRHLREDLELVRSGVLWRVAPRGAPAPLPERWLPSEDLRRLGARIGRARGTTLRREGRDLVVTWEPYELKALEALARSRVDLALQRPELAPDALLAALEAFPPLGRETPFLGHLGETLSAAGRLPEGEATFREALAAPEGGLRRSLGAAFLAELAGRRGDYPRARQLKEEALRHAPEDPSIRARLRERLEAVR